MSPWHSVTAFAKQLPLFDELAPSTRGAVQLCLPLSFEAPAEPAWDETQRWLAEFGWEQAEFTPGEWACIEPHLPPSKGPRRKDFRILNAIFWILRTGSPWRDLPARFGPVSSAHTRLQRWQCSGLWDQLLGAMHRDEHQAGRLDWSQHSLDSTTSRAHHHAAGAVQPQPDLGGDLESLGRSRGGLTTKVHMRTDGRGRPMALVLTAGQRNDNLVVEHLVDAAPVQGSRGRARMRPEAIAADKAYSSHKNRALLRRRRIKAVIPKPSCQKAKTRYDKQAYKARNLVERAFNWLKRYRRLATRYEKRARNFLAFWLIGSIRLWIRDPFAP